MSNIGILEEPEAISETPEAISDKLEIISEKPKAHLKPVVLTAENITQFSISDVVLPLPGYDVIFPENETQQWYKEQLEKDGMGNFDFVHRVK